MKELTFASVKGEYLVEVLTPQKEIIRPFGDKPLKNLILDTFFTSVLSGYAPSPQAYIQSCKAGDSSLPAQRSNMGLSGNQVDITHASSVFYVSAEQINNRIYMSRDFTFSPVSAQKTYREMCIGSFGIQRIPDITTSRFVFPSDVTLNTGDTLRITYTLYISMSGLFNNITIPVLNSSSLGLDFSGYIRSTSDDLNLLSNLPTSNITYVNMGGSVPGLGSPNDAVYVYRNFTDSNVLVTAATTNSYGKVAQIFNTRIEPANTNGFFTSAHTPSIYPTARGAYTASGPYGYITLSNLQLTDNYSSIDVSYYFPPHTSARTVTGMYLWRCASAFSGYATYMVFNSPQTIPANVPIQFKLRWYFTR